MKIFGLTGNIGTGKSTVAQLLKQLGASIIDADEIAREVVKPGKPAWKKIVNNFGEEILNTDNTINRKKLGELVFGDKSRIERLNSFTHPHILSEIKKRISENRIKGNKVSIIEAALLTGEGKLGSILDGLIVVTADKSKRIERIMKRDNLTEKEVLTRINSQVTDSEKVKGADYMVDNSLDIKELQKEVESLWHQITG